MVLYTAKGKISHGQLEFAEDQIHYTVSGQSEQESWDYSQLKKVELTARQIKLTPTKEKELKFALGASKAFDATTAEFLRAKVGSSLKAKKL